MIRQRGFAMGLLAYGLIALALLGILGTMGYKAYQAGKDSVYVEWDKANRKARDEADRLRITRQKESDNAVVALQHAQKEAKDHEQRWNEARKALRRLGKPVVASVCPQATRTHAAAPDAAVADPGDPRLTWASVWLWDSSWTDGTGKPLFPHPEGAITDPASAGASAYTVGEALDNQALNASRCSENSRQLGSLIRLLERLRGTDK